MKGFRRFVDVVYELRVGEVCCLVCSLTVRNSLERKSQLSVVGLSREDVSESL